ncbi:MAG: serine hydrolase [Bacteroidota bacterium]
MNGWSVVLLVLLFPYNAYNQSNTRELLEAVKGTDSLVDAVLANSDKFRLQFIITTINRSEGAKTTWKDYPMITGQYFFPASVVKLPTAIITGEQLDSLNVGLNSRIVMNQDVTCGSSRFVKRSVDNDLRFANVLEEMLTISDNDHFSLLFHFLGPRALNNGLMQRKILNTKIYSSYSGCEKRAAITTNSFTIYDEAGQKQYFRPMQSLELNYFEDRLKYSKQKLIGTSYYSGKKLIKEPFDFNFYHDYPLTDIHNTLKRLIFPQLFEQGQAFDLSENTRDHLLRSMGKFPCEMVNPIYQDRTKYPDNYHKYSIFGEDSLGVKRERFRTISKIGISYGFITETAYIIDFEQQKDLLFTVSMYVNTDGVLNDARYDYENIARPFLARFTQLICDHLFVQPEISNMSDAEINKYLKLFGMDH